MLISLLPCFLNVVSSLICRHCGEPRAGLFEVCAGCDTLLAGPYMVWIFVSLTMFVGALVALPVFATTGTDSRWVDAAALTLIASVASLGLSLLMTYAPLLRRR